MPGCLMNKLASLLVFAVASPAWSATFEDFDGPYAVTSWSASGITGGSAYVDVAASTTTEAVFVYDVDLGYPGPGVSYRTSDYSISATVDGTVTFDWAFDYDHRIHQAQVELYVWSEDASGVRTETQIHYDDVKLGLFGPDSAYGSVTGLQVASGRPFGIEMGGSNLDADSRIGGTLVMSSFTLDADDVDCNGVPGGPAEEDFCGTCDANPYNDCVQDCAGVFGGSATLDDCGVCDDDPTNDCGPDCNGVAGGGATEDMGGTCDTNPNNACVQDCAGVWGGTSQTDNCGTCDDDVGNDCVQDCAGTWGGDAIYDDCGECVGGTTGREPCVLDTADTGGTDVPSTTGGTTPGTTPTGGTTPTDPGTDPTTPGTDDTGFPAPEPVSYQQVGGCGCASAPSGWGWWLLAASPLVLLRRR